MIIINDSDYMNNSYTFFGPMEIAFYDDGNVFDDYPMKMFLSIFLGISMIVSIIGNVCTCAVIARDRSMRTPTNCYLANLAVTDLLLSLFVPLEIYLIWVPDFYPLGEVGCRLHLILWDVLCNCNLLTITAFTIERYLVITKPFLRQKLALNSRVFKIVAVIWVISLSFCIPDVFYIDFLERKKYVFCYYTLSNLLSIFAEVEIFVFYLIPMTIIVVLYVLIKIELNSSRNKLRTSPVNGTNHRDKAVRMLAAVAASFFICWSPYCVLRIMMVYPKYKIYDDNYNLWKTINYLSYNGYMSSAANPILYSLMSRKFREAFKDFFKGRRSVSRKRNVIL